MDIKDVQIREMSPEETPQLADLLTSSLLGDHSKSKTILKLLGKRKSILWMVFLSVLVYHLTGSLSWAFVVPPIIVMLGILRSLATWTHCTAPEVFRTSDVFSPCGGGKSRRTWVAVCDGRVAGSVTLIRHSDSLGELCRMRVGREHQRKGVGRRLVEHLEEYCRDDGVKQIVLTTSEYHERAIRLYRRCGYIRDNTGDYSKALFPGVGDPAINVAVQVYAFRKELML
ncbi:putative N-acetyltransferase 14 [Branchiostoma floridae x Branchiostoma japonicum]